MTAALGAAALTLSLALAVPAQARSGEAHDRVAHQSGGHKTQSVDSQSRQTAESGSGVFFDAGVSQIVETRQLKRRPWKR